MSRLGGFRSVFLAAAWLAALPSLAPAAEDAGTHSVFAAGVGNRALALGSAFSAVADDPSAAVWNPAGLALLSRTEFLATHASVGDLGFRELYGALALPSWRLGTAALSVRHFAVDGIEERDDRNVLLSSDLANVETEIALGFARPVGRLWNVGGAVKLQRQSLAGLSASGLGLDLGVLVRPFAAAGGGASPAEHLTLGVSIRNAVEPRLRLDEESVPDPSTLRLGAAYTHVFPGGQRLLTTIDGEKPDGSTARLHTGLELRLHPLFDLRAGWNRGSWTAGAGLRWRDLGMDYAFEDDAVSPTHRFGFSVQFGPTTHERREIAQRREEEAFQERLEKAFDDRNQSQVADLLEQSARAAADARYGEALDMLSMVSALDPGNPRVTPLEAQILARQAEELLRLGHTSEAEVALLRAAELAPGDSAIAEALAACRRQENETAQRSRGLRERYADAIDAFSREDFARALAGFEWVVAQNPADAQATEMLERTRAAIAQRTEARLRLAQELTRVGAWDHAAEALAQARQQGGDLRAIEEAERALEQARRKPGPTALAPARPTVAGDATSPAGGTVAKDDQPTPRRTRLSEREQRELAAHYRQGVEAYQRGDAEDAIRYWEIVWAAAPDYPGVANSLKREYLAGGMEAFASGHFETSVQLWKKALRVDPDDGRTRGYLARAEERLARSRDILRRMKDGER